MELSAGYKRTELGVIPQQWGVKPLGEIGSVLMCKRVLKHQTHERGDVPFYKIGTFGGVADAFIPQSLYDEFRRKYSFPRKGDVLISAAGTIGRTVIYDGAPAYFQDSNIVWIDNDESTVTNAFLWHRYQVTKWSVSHGGTVARLYNENIRADIHIPVPAIPEQRAIATALSDVDALLAKIDQIIAKKRDLKQAAMQQLLTGQTRLPGFSGEWEVKPMKSLGQTYGGLAGKIKEDFGHGSSKYIPFMNVMTDTVIDPNWLETVDIAQNEAQNLVKKGDLFFNGSSETPEEVGFCSVLLEDIPNLYLNSFCFGFRFNTDAKVSGLFFAYWFRGADGRAAMSVLAQGATRYNIAKSAFMRLSIPQPSQEEQTAITTVLSDMDAELAALEARRDKTRGLKQGMMQALLTGRIRLVGGN